MDIYFLVKTLHILSSTVLFGTGLGIAFLNFWGQRQRSLSDRYFAARMTVLMDILFTTPAVILQPISGFILVSLGGFNVFEPWLVVSYTLYMIAGVCWVPVVWLQLRIRDMLKEALRTHTTIEQLPALYHRYMRIWFVLGWPAFIGLVMAFYLMVVKGILA